MHNVCSEVQTVLSQSRQLDENEDVNSEVCETVLGNKSDACELSHAYNKQDDTAICHKYSNVNAVKCDQSEVIILDKK